jgi:hypothetical protein
MFQCLTFEEFIFSLLLENNTNTKEKANGNFTLKL